MHTALSTGSLWPVLLANSALLAKVNDQRSCEQTGWSTEGMFTKVRWTGRVTLGFRGIEGGPVELFSFTCV